mmetsp:Transcript_35772/g.63840  ORF Transcript_35772/g.63840 Transcript_35772/m.63840 type:complete len:247 (+) Transcript_35772:126-866(+)
MQPGLHCCESRGRGERSNSIGKNNSLRKTIQAHGDGAGLDLRVVHAVYGRLRGIRGLEADSAKAPGAPRVVLDDVSTLHLAAAGERLGECLGRAAPREVVHHNLEPTRLAGGAWGRLALTSRPAATAAPATATATTLRHAAISGHIPAWLSTRSTLHKAAVRAGHIHSLRAAILACLDFELYNLALGQATESLSVDARLVHEQVLGRLFGALRHLGGDEAEALGGVEPLNSPLLLIRHLDALKRPG